MVLEAALAPLPRGAVIPQRVSIGPRISHAWGGGCHFPQGCPRYHSLTPSVVQSLKSTKESLCNLKRKTTTVEHLGQAQYVRRGNRGKDGRTEPLSLFYYEPHIHPSEHICQEPFLLFPSRFISRNKTTQWANIPSSKQAPGAAHLPKPLQVLSYFMNTVGSSRCGTL